ncbi:FtsX-like permease family protein [Paenibacillus antri]|uniref:FtsX-like permease family protein n=1 Tax=Paenibacillus antri TaxID=2582848 RepID=A0A5R9G7C8_9BACL|nr:FtsX-like permease family protein [Paenibacillus antri]TLS52317.1 FtsX-like permease family protein [Paenibacillus antri]
MIAILTMLFRKMAKNRWLVAGLLAGMCLCTALTSSMPIYKNASLQRMLTKELERHYERTSTYPGSIMATGTPNFQPEDAEKQAAFLKSYDALWEKDALLDPSLTALDYVKERQTVTFRIVPADPTRMDPEENRVAKLVMRTGLEEHVRLIDGRMPSPEPQNGVYEALVTDSTLVKLGMVLGVEVVSDDDDWGEQIRIVPVGVVAETDLNDMYWDFMRLSAYDATFILDDALFEAEIVDGAKVPIGNARWEASFDYNRFTLESAIRFTELKERIDAEYKKRMPFNSTVRAPAEAIMSVYEEKEATLESLLWSLNVPLYILVAFYLYMVSGLLVDKQKSEVAVLRSRGAGRWQLIALFAMESAALSIVALLIGPYLGAAFTAVLGSSDSFMSFVQRKALPVRVDGESFAFAGAAAAFSFVVYLIPVFLATRFSIVDQKRASARGNRASVWHRFGLDAVLLAVSLYGLYTFRKRVAEMTALGLDAGAIATDPLLFAVPSMFILGFGLALLRLYPWFVKLVYWIGKSRWTASQYSSLLQVGRRSRQYELFMMFLVLTVGTGLYSASAARTINGNMEDQIWYAQGADVVLRQDWVDDAPPPAGPGMEAPPPVSDRINYLEPDFGVFSSLPGVRSAARVFTKEKAVVWTQEENVQARLIGIHTDEFGMTSWMKDGLLPYHFYEYLNLIAPDPRAVLVSRSMAEAFELTPGDVIDVGWSDTSRMQATVYGTIDYFPTFNPNPAGAEANPDAPKPYLVVGHLETIQNELALEPYDVWIDVASPDDREALYAAIGEKRIQLVSLVDTNELVADSRSDPFRMAMNGVMSLGFLLSLAITLVGFLLYWVLALQGRTLQFGIFRAMGLTFRNIVGMLGTEQLLTSGAGFAIGLLSGATASYLFVPLFQLSFDPGRVVPPFQVMIEAQDTTRLLLFIAAMLVVALIALAASLRRVKLHQALKLGED